MNNSLRFLAPGAAILSIFAFASCGGVSSSDVADIDGTTISKTTFNRWVAVAANSSQDPAAKAAGVPDPPNYTKCIAAKTKAAGRPVKGQPLPNPATYKTECDQQYTQLKDQVMTFLIRSEWLELQANEMGITVSDTKVKAEFLKARKQAFPEDKQYADFLKTSGQTEADLLYRQRSQMLEQKITAQAQKDSKTVSDADISAYYKKNQAQFTQPATRDLNVILTKTEAQANKAKAALEGGASFASVANQYSIDAASKKDGGKLPAVAQGSQEGAFDKAIFSAPLNKVVGPVKTSLGYYVFEVTKETPKKVQTEAQAAKAIKPIVTSEKGQKALTNFGKIYQARWKEMTECQTGYIVADCNNYKKPKTTPTTSTPQQTPTAPPAGG
jgi:foldase protein PrsA